MQDLIIAIFSSLTFQSARRPCPHFVYKTHTEIELNQDQWNKCVGIWDIAIIFYLCGYGYSGKYDYLWLEKPGSCQEWVKTLKTKIEKWIQGYGSRLHGYVQLNPRRS
jgi:hypothetical protein